MSLLRRDPEVLTKGARLRNLLILQNAVPQKHLHLKTTDSVNKLFTWVETAGVVTNTEFFRQTYTALFASF